MAHRPLRRYVLRTLAVLAAGIGICVLLFLLGFFPQEWLRPIVEREIRAALGPGSTIGHLHVVPGRLRAEATDVRIEGRGFRLETPRLTIAIAVPMLLGRAVTVRSLAMERPVLTVWPVEPVAGAEPTKPFEQTVLVGDIAISEGTLIYRDPALGGDWRVENLRLTGGVGKDTLKLETGPVRWERPDPLVLEPVRATLSLSPRLLARLESLELGTGRSRLTASGDIGDLISPTLDVQAKVRLDLADLALVPNAPKATGIVEGEAHLTGGVPDITTKGTLQGRGLVISGQRVDAGKIQFSREGTKTQLALDASALGGRIDAKADLDGSRLNASARGKDLDLRAFAGPDTPGRASLDARASGTMGQRLDTTVHIEGAGKSASVAFTARADVSGALVGAEYEANLHWTATGTASQPADPAGGPTLQALDWNAEGTAVGAWPAPAINGRLAGNGRFEAAQRPSPFQLTGDVGSKGNTSTITAILTGDLGRMNAQATMTRGGATQFTVDARDVRLERFVRGASGVAAFAFQGRQRPGALTASGRGTIADLVSNDLRFGTVTVEAKADGDVTRATIQIPEMKASIDATLEPVRRGSSALAVAAHVELQDSPLAPLAPMAGRPLAGRIRGAFDIRAPFGALADATVEGRIDALDFESQRLKGSLQQPAHIEANNRRLAVRDLAIKGPGFELLTTGSFGLVPAEAFDATMKATVDLTQLPASVDWTLAGSANADVRLQGTRARPLVYGAVDLAGFSAAGPSVPSLQAEKARLELAGESMRIAETQATLAGGTLRLSGTVPLSSVVETPGRAAEPAHLDLVWSGVDATQIHLAAAPDSEVAISGLLEGEAHVVGSLRSMAGMTARVRTPALRLQVEQMPITISGINLDVAGGRATLASMQIGTPHGSLQVAGGADLSARTIDGTARGALDLRALSPFMENAALTGKAELDLTVNGPFASLRPEGRMVVSDAVLRMRDIQPAVTNINGAVLFDRTQLRIPDARARWGGGPVTVSGQAAIEKAGLRDANFSIKGEQMALEYLEARLFADADLTLTGRTGDLKLAGSVVANRGLYSKDIFLEDPLRAPEVATTSSPFLQTIGLRLSVRLREFVVSNNIANLRARGTFTVIGTADEPAPFGRVSIPEGGTVLIQQKKFVIKEERATLRYEGTLSPTLEIVAETERFKWTNEAGGEEEGTIQVRIAGDLERPLLEFESATHSDLSQTEMASIIATGTEDARQIRGEWLVGAQMASLFASHLTHGVSQGLRGFGLDEVSIQPELITREADPSARITFGKNVTSWTRLVYSFTTTGTEEPFFRLEVRPTGGIKASLARRDDNSYTGTLTHRLQLGAPTPSQPRTGRDPSAPVRIAEVRFDGAPELEPKVLEQWAGVSAGKKRTLWDVQDAGARLQRRLAEQGHIEAQVEARLEDDSAMFDVRPGPRYAWRVTGMETPPDLTSIVRRALYTEEALATGGDRLVKALRDRGHHKAVVRTAMQENGNERTLVFTAEPGPVFAAANVVFEGASALSHKTLLDAAGGAGEFVTEPARARGRVEERYREEFFLQAKVGRPRVEEAAGRITVTVPIQEGRQANIARVTFVGSSLHETELDGMAGGIVGAPPDVFGVPGLLQRIRERYFGLGYPESRVSSRMIPTDGDVEVRVEIHEGPQVHIREIVFVGESRVSERTMRRALPFREGDPLDPRDLSKGEVKLSEYKVRARVASDEKDISRIVVTLRRSARVVAEYGAEMDTRSRPGVNVEVRAPNLLPGGVTPSVSFSEKQDIRDIRGNLSMPALLHRGALNVHYAFRDEVRIVEPDTDEVAKGEPVPFNEVTQRGSLSQIVEIGNQWRLDYGYELARTWTTTPMIITPVISNNGKLRLSLLRDTRDHLLDARRGRFWSMSLAYTPPVLWRDTPFLKGFVQVSAYRPLANTLTWAQSYRFGAGRGLGDNPRLVIIERFSAGGASSLRGYGADTVGPLSGFVKGKASGDAVLVLNQELRYHHGSGLGAAVFYDVGNVYERVSRIQAGLRHSLGAGLRYDSPVGLVRLDIGVPINRRKDTEPYQVFLSLGQAF